MVGMDMMGRLEAPKTVAMRIVQTNKVGGAMDTDPSGISPQSLSTLEIQALLQQYGKVEDLQPAIQAPRPLLPPTGRLVDVEQPA